MWDIDTDWASFETVKYILSAFFKSGGQMFQGNMTDVAELKKAEENPENYPRLIVRVGGFSANFLSLDKTVRAEVIGRMRHSK